MAEGHFILSESPAHPVAVLGESQERWGNGGQQMCPHDAPFGHRPALVGHEDLKELSLLVGGRRVVRQVHFEGADRNVRHEADEGRERMSDHSELPNRVVQGRGPPADLDH